MKLLVTSLAVVSAVSLLAACGQKSETPPATEAEASSSAPAAADPNAAMPNAATAGDMAGMNMAGMNMSGAKMAKATGTVTAVDPAAGTITLDHSAVPEAGWPAMSMAFKAPAPLMESTKVGDKVNVDLMIRDGAGEIMSLTKQ